MFKQSLRCTLSAILISACSDLPAAKITIDASKMLRRYDRRMLLGSNVALWHNRDVYSDAGVNKWFTEWAPGMMRMPGGSWSDIAFWNGNGVRRPDGSIDHSQYKDNYPLIDYSAYAPSICVEMDWSGIRKGNWHGNVDVKTQHDFIKGLPECETMVTVNAGTGRASDAAEWVRWANKEMGYNVKYWEVGNELDGSWEGGHYLRQGGEMTGEIYAARYRDFARAMKAVDPTIKVGGAADGTSAESFAAAMLRDAGDYVDFVSWHTYPCQAGLDEQEMFKRTDISKPMNSLKRLIKKYQPARTDEIEIGLTEWNLHSDRTASDIINSLWSCIWIGEMVKEGMDFATQWDAFTQGQKETGGHALIISGKPFQRKSQYWAFWLWRYFMGNEYIQSAADGPEHLYSLATRSSNAVYIMLVNHSREEEERTTIKLTGFAAAAQGEVAVYSQREYFWNHLTREIEWNRGPRVLPLTTGNSFSVTVPPFSVKFIKIPSASKPGLSQLALHHQKALGDAGDPLLRIQAPKESYAGQPIECWVRAYRTGSQESYLKELPDAALQVTGPASIDRSAARLKEAAGRFFVTASAPGLVTVKANSGDLSAKVQIMIKESISTPKVIWDFEEEKPGAGYKSDYLLSTDASQVANRRVARIDLDKAPPATKEKRLVLMLHSIPREIDRSRVRGFFFKMKVEPGLTSTDPAAGVDIILQSEANYWMPQGKVEFLKCEGAWKEYKFEFSEEHQKAAYKLLCAWLVISTKAPVTGTVYVDKVGLLIR